MVSTWQCVFDHHELDNLYAIYKDPCQRELLFSSAELSYKFTRGCIIAAIKSLGSPCNVERSDIFYNNIVQFWDEPNPPSDVSECMSSWSALGTQINKFDDDLAIEFIREYFSAEELECYLYCHHPAMRADYFRLAFLLQKGGVYIDADDSRKENVDRTFLSRPSGLSLRPLAFSFTENRNLHLHEAVDDSTSYGNIAFYFNNTPIFSKAEHPIILKAFQRATRNIIIQKNKGALADIHLHTGPSNLTFSVLEYSIEKSLHGEELDFDVVIDWDCVAVTEPLCYKATNRNWRENSDLYEIKTEAGENNMSEIKSVFASKYHEGGSEWGGHSGPGSIAYYTADYRHFVERFIFMNQIKSVVDIGCGDWQFSRYIDYSGVTYHGYDVVDHIIEVNRQNYNLPGINFHVMPKIIKELEKADLLIIKDVLQHLPNKEIFQFLHEVIPKYRYALITNSYQKVSVAANTDISLGEFRVLDLTADPYNVKGTYVCEFGSAVWERLRTLLIVNLEV